jgi:hypothetical protein
MRHKETRTMTRHDSKAIHQCHAFTRLELVACLAGLAVLVSLALPALAATTSRSHVVQCLNNLRQVGRGVQVWGADHQNDPPWRTLVSDGGTQPNSGTKPGNAWFEFTAMSNEIFTPRILACPADAGVQVATDYSAYLTLKQFATSYLINLHNLGSAPQTVLCGDRNVRFSPGSTSCAYGVNNVSSYDLLAPSGNAWTNAVHSFQGNVVLMDGSVFETTSTQLHAALGRSDENGTVHLLKAR